MMDRQRQERDLQEVFEATQTSWRAAIENTFALQEANTRVRSKLEQGSSRSLGGTG
jgi:hypothetical protein